jgi:hypothetical protein
MADPSLSDVSDHVFAILDPAAVSEHAGLPARLSLRLLSENPSRGELSLELGLAAAGDAVVDIYTADGRLIESIPQLKLPAGWYPLTLQRATLTDHPVSSGVYFVQAKSGSEISQKKIVVVR